MERMKLVGRITPKSSNEVTVSRLGIGFEKLDRGVFDPKKAYDRVAELGCKWVRIQSGWARTETEKGVYHFDWLDEIVDNLIERGLVPWICLCYGNGLYTPMACEIFGAVGCPPVAAQEEHDAWISYVSALVVHYRGKVRHYEIWNEPDGVWCWKHGVNALEYGEFARDTACAIRSADSGSYIIGGAICMRDLRYINEALATGMGKEIDAISYHDYTVDETRIAERVASLRSLGRLYNPQMDIIQGESGSQSRSDGCGALRGGAWTPLKQAKQLLRHAIADLASGVLFSSYFSCMDMIEALNGKVGDLASYQDFGYFGVLAADFDENGIATGTYTPKKSYWALQNLCSLLSERFECTELPILRWPAASPRVFHDDCDDSTMMTIGIKKPNGACAYVYWNATDLMTSTYESTMTVQAAGLNRKINLIDPMEGSIYELPESMIEDQGCGCLMLRHIPITDYPLFLTFGDFMG